MGFLDKIRAKSAGAEETIIHAQEEAPTFAHVTWYRDPGMRKLYFFAFILCVASATTGYDGMLFNSLQQMNSWQERFDHPEGSELGVLGALYQIGSLASIPFVPLFTDHLGRKFPIAVGSLIMIAGAIVQSTANEMPAFMGGRVMLGFGNSLAQIASPMLLTEICHPQHRARLTTVYNCLWNVGALIVSWLAFGTHFLSTDWAWRIPSLIQCLPSLIQIVFIWWVPESPRYLIAKDKHEKALEIFARYHANGDVNNATVQFEYREVRETIRMEMESKKNSSYMDFFRTKGNRYRLAVLISLGFFSQWSGNAIISNYIGVLYTQAGILGETQQLGLSGGQTGLSLIVSVTMALNVDRFGRRPLFLIATGGMFFTFIIWTLTAGLYEDHNAKGSNYAMVVFVWIFGIFYSVAWSGLLVGYAIEILPYKLRGKGLMILNICIQGALTLNIYANPVAFEYFEPHVWKFYLIYMCWIFCEFCFVYFMYVETKGPTLEELAKIIDGDEADVAQVDLHQVEKEIHLTGTHDEAADSPRKLEDRI